MKIIIYLFIAVLSLTTFFGCKRNHHDADPIDDLKKNLKGEWKIVKVTLSGTDVTSFYTGLTLTFDDTNQYACQHSVAPVWPAQGTYEIKIENDISLMLRSDNLRVTIKEVTPSKLLLDFYWTGLPPTGGRVNSLNGDYEFEYSR